MARTIAFCVALFFLMPGVCSLAASANPAANTLAHLQNDLNNSSLLQAVRRSIDYLNKAPQQSFTIAGKELTTTHVIHALLTMQHLLQQHLSPAKFAQEVEKNYVVLQADGLTDSPGTMLVTGYYQPVFNGSMVKKSPYLYPLYSPPLDLIIQKQSNGASRIGRYEGNSFLPYWTRAEIDSMGKIAGHELVWLQDPLDVFFLHVQGSGIIRLQDGTERSVHYASGNGQPYKSIGKYMVQTGRISLKTASMQTIRQYIQEHPEERNEILFTNPSYIFFNWSQTQGAIGSIGQELTPGRSIAVDKHSFPLGALAYLITREPLLSDAAINGWKPVHRLVLMQDTGSAIKGTGRVDLFLGSGKNAGAKAGVMKETGKLFLLFLKKDIK